MKFTLPRFASEQIEVDPDTIISFPGGIPGFEGCTRYTLLHDAASDSPRVFWLQSLDDPSVAFSLTDPEYLNIAYELAISDEEQRALDFADGDELSIAVMVSQLDEDGIHANTQAPIAFNINKRLAIQKPLTRTAQPIHA